MKVVVSYRWEEKGGNEKFVIRSFTRIRLVDDHYDMLLLYMY